MILFLISFFSFFFNDTAPTEIYTLSLHDALPISVVPLHQLRSNVCDSSAYSAIKALIAELAPSLRSEEHTSELQSHSDLVCRLLLEKKKKKKTNLTCHIRKRTIVPKYE